MLREGSLEVSQMWNQGAIYETISGKGDQTLIREIKITRGNQELNTHYEKS